MSESDLGVALTATNSEDRLVQQTFAAHLPDVLGRETVYAFNTETFRPSGTHGRDSERGCGPRARITLFAGADILLT